MSRKFGFILFLVFYTNFIFPKVTDAQSQPLDEGQSPFIDWEIHGEGNMHPTIHKKESLGNGVIRLTLKFPKPQIITPNESPNPESLIRLPRLQDMIDGIGYRVPSFAYVIQGKILSASVNQRSGGGSLKAKLTFRPKEIDDTPIGNDGPIDRPASLAARALEDKIYPLSEVQSYFGGSMRGVPVSTIKVAPYRYDPKRHELRYYETLVIDLRYDQSESRDVEIGLDEEKIMKQTPQKRTPYAYSGKSLHTSLAMPNIKGTQNQLLSMPFSQIPGLSTLPVRPKAKLILDRDGVYRLGFFELQQALRNGGITQDFFSCDPRTIRLFNKGIEIPIIVRGEQDGAFNRNDFIEFSGEKNALRLQDPQRPEMYSDPYSDDNVYYLHWDGQLNATNRGLRLVEIPAEIRSTVARGFDLTNQYYQSTLHFERDLGGLGGLVPSQSIEQNLSRVFARFNTPEYRRTRNESDFRDRAFWAAIFLNTQRQFEIDVPGLADVADDSIRIRVAYHGLSYDQRFTPQNRAVFQLGNVVVGLTEWGNGSNSQDIKMDNFVTSARQFFRGVRREYDTIKVVQIANQDNDGTLLPGEEGRSFFVNWFQVTYPRTYRAFDDQISFTIPRGRPAGRYQFTITGFTTPEINIYKRGVGILSNLSIEPYFEVVETPDGNLERVGKELYRVRFQDDVINPNDIMYEAMPANRKLQPKRIERVLPSNLYEPTVRLIDKSNDYNYIIITSQRFVNDQNFNDSRNLINQYKTYREQRLTQMGERSRVLVVTAESIYDEFNHGIKSPRAIRDFLDYAYHEWREAPIYVLLMGGAFRIKNEGNLVPTMRMQTIEFGATASDAWYVMIDGIDESGQLDLLPDMQISRIAASTPTDIANYLEKLKIYETYSVKGEWRNRILMIAGEASRGNVAFDPNDNKVIQTDEILRLNVNRNFFISRINTGAGRDIRNPEEDIFLGNSITLRNFINNEGCLVMNFIGHGGGAVWSDSQVLELNDVALLTNRDIFPFVTSMCCFTGAFDDGIGAYTISQALTLSKLAGGIGVIASAGFGWYRNDFLMTQSVYEFLLTDQYQGLSIADMLFRGKTRYYLLYKFTDIDIAPSMMLQYGVFGDPAVRLAAAGVTPQKNSISGGVNSISINPISSIVAINDSLRIVGQVEGITNGVGFGKITDQDNMHVTLQLTEFAVRNGRIGQVLGGVFRETLAVHVPQPPRITTTNIQNFRGGQFQFYIMSNTPSTTPQFSGDVSGRVPFLLSGTAFRALSSNIPISTSAGRSVQFQADIQSSTPIDSVRIVSEVYRPSPVNLTQNVLMFNRTFQTVRQGSRFSMQDSIPGAVLRPTRRVVYYSEMFSQGTRRLSPINIEFVGQTPDVGAVPKARTGLIQYYENNSIGLSVMDNKAFMTAEVYNWTERPVDRVAVTFLENSINNRQTAQIPILRTIRTELGRDTVSLQPEDPSRTSGALAKVALPDTTPLFKRFQVGINVIADTSGELFESNYSNNLSTQKEVVYDLLFIPTEGTDSIQTIERNVALTIRREAIGNAAFLRVNKVTEPNVFFQPDNQFVRFQYQAEAQPISYSITRLDSGLVLQRPTVMTFMIDKSAFLGSRQNIFAYRFSPQIQRWLKIPNQRRDSDTTITVEVDELGQFALMHTTDLVKPIVTLGIEGQAYIPNGPAPRRPRISITIQDQNGVFLDRRMMRVVRNGDSSEAVQSKLLVPQASFNANTIGIVYDDFITEQGMQEFVFVFNDANLNEIRTEPMRFFVQANFEMEVYGVYPNPFEEETRIVYEIKGVELKAEVVEIKIYTVSGRLINSLRDGEIGASGLFSDPQEDLLAPGPKTIVWKGVDRNGAPVANGVYYIRVRAIYQGRVFEKVIKAAKIR